MLALVVFALHLALLALRVVLAITFAFCALVVLGLAFRHVGVVVLSVRVVVALASPMPVALADLATFFPFPPLVWLRSMPMGVGSSNLVVSSDQLL